MSSNFVLLIVSILLIGVTALSIGSTVAMVSRTSVSPPDFASFNSWSRLLVGTSVPIKQNNLNGDNYAIQAADTLQPQQKTVRGSSLEVSPIVNLGFPYIKYTAKPKGTTGLLKLNGNIILTVTNSSPADQVFVLGLASRTSAPDDQPLGEGDTVKFFGQTAYLINTNISNSRTLFQSFEQVVEVSTADKVLYFFPYYSSSNAVGSQPFSGDLVVSSINLTVSEV